MKIELNLTPWMTPDFVSIEMPAQFRQDGWRESPAIPLADVDVAILSDMCDVFRAEVFEKAGKPDPATHQHQRQQIALIKQEAARQASAAEVARTHSDPDAPERARTHDFCAAVLESLIGEA